jgi:hypothetical protein
MADTATPNPDTGLLPRTYFKAPRVPLDLRALFLAFVAYAIFRGGEWLLTKVFDGVDPVAVFFSRVFGGFAGGLFHFLPGFGDVVEARVGGYGNVWQAIVGGLWLLLVLGFFGQAIHRITALRIARDEGMSLKDSIAFAKKNFTTILWCPLIVAAFALVLLGCNALAGALIAIDYVGQILALVLVPLAMISSLLALLILIGAFVGMPLVAAAAAWERNGSLDALSRAFSYVFARPLQFFWNYFLILVFVGVITWAGNAFERILVGSIDWGLWRETPSVVVNTPPSGAELRNEDARKLYVELGAETEKRPYALSAKSIEKTPMSHKLTAIVFWVVLNLVELLVAGAALWWFLGATTSTYADLRADVDGTEEDEIYLEEEEEDFDALATPPPPPATSPPTGTVPPSASTTPPSAPPPMPPAT